jgi:hypothetical protein
MKKNKKRKATKFKTIKIKVSAKQKRSLENFCKARRTTPNKIIKKAIRPLLENYVNAIPLKNQEKVKQLMLFPSEGS